MTAPFDDQAAARHPELEAMIQAARRQPAPPSRLTIEDLQRASGRRLQWRVAALAIAAGLAALTVWALRGPASIEPAPSAVVRTDSEFASPEPAPVEAESTALPARVALERGATVERLDADGVVGDLSTHPGRYLIRTADEPLSLPIAARVLEVAAASAVIVDTRVEVVTLEVRRGEAAWAEPEPEPGLPIDADAPVAPTTTASQLAAQAEAAMLAGQRAEAAGVLRTLVRKHPRSAAAKAGLVDLARLEKALGRPERAHCAYALFVDRFASDSRAPAVRTADEALGLAGVQCRGLNPRRD